MQMVDANAVTVARSVGLFLLYAFIFWRLFKDNRGNRVIQCGSITLMLFLVMLALARIPNLPVDYVAWLGPALFLLCMLTMFFLFQQGYRALRKRFAVKHVSLEAEAYKLTTDELLKRMPKEQAIIQVQGILRLMERSMNVPDIPAAKIRMENVLEELKRS